jgi:putative copper resistance protein D
MEVLPSPSAVHNLTDPLIYVRAIHFAATIMAAGTVFFLAFIAEPAFRTASDATRVPAVVRYRLTWIAWISLALAVISGAAWLVFTAGSMSGRPPVEVFAEGVLWTVLGQTEFGNDWVLRLVLACLLAAAFARFLSAQRIKPLWFKATSVVLAATFVGSLAWAGHAAGAVGFEAIVHPAADVLHLVAAAAWVGALVPLALLLGAAGQVGSIAIARTATLRFSTYGIASVATLLVTGIINSWYLTGSIPALLGTDYGRLLLAKIALFLGMVAIAAVNRFRLTPRIVQDANTAATPAALRQLRGNAAIEASVGAIVIIIVAVLGTLPPAAHAHHDPAYAAIPADAAFVHIHTEQGMAEVTIMPGRVGTARATIHLLNKDFGPLDAQEVTLTLTSPTAGSKPTTRVALQGPDESWQVDGIELLQPGNWTVAVSAVLGSTRRVVLDAPIVIEKKQ